MTDPLSQHDTSQAAPPAATGSVSLAERLCLLIVVIASALAMSPNVADPDLWGHVQFGRDVLQDGEIAATTSYSFTAEGYRWVNHENLSEIVMAVVADSLGPLGLVFGKFLLSLFVILAVLRFNLKSGTGLTVASIMTLLVAANLGYHWSIRPQLSSFVCFTLLILLFQFSFTGWRDRWLLTCGCSTEVDPQQPIPIRSVLGYQSARLRCLWLLVPLFVLWTNSHGGFVAGICVAVAYLGMRAMEALCQGHRPGQPIRMNAGWGIARRMALMATVAGLATFLNPYGPNLQFWLLDSLGSPRPEISDWSTSQLFTLVGMKLWLLVAVSLFAVTATRKKADATQLVILALLLWQSVSHFRHVPFFAIAAGFWLGPHLKSAMDRFASSPAANRVPGRRAQFALNACLVLVLAGSGYTLQTRLSDLQVRRDTFPVDAIDFMRQNGLHGKLVVTYDWAQYSIAALCSEHYADHPDRLSRVAFDGRFRTCYPQSIVDMHFDFLYGNSQGVQRHRSNDSAEVDPFRVLEHGQPQLVLLRRSGEITEQHMNASTANWVLLYQDAIAQVWGRRSLYDNPQSPCWLPVEKRIIHDRLSSDSVTWPAIQRHKREPSPGVSLTQVADFLSR